MPHRHHRPAGHADHPDPQERTALDGRLPGRNRQKRDPTSHSPPWQGVLEALDGISRPKSDRGKDALAGSLEPVALNRLDLKAFGERIAARRPDSQTAEIQIRVALINRFNALGTAEIVRVA